MSTDLASTSANTNNFLSFTDWLDSSQPYESSARLNPTELLNLNSDEEIVKRIQGSLIGLAVGDALGAYVEFRPREYLKAHPVKDMQSGGTWGLRAGQWTDDTSMALCLAASLISKGYFDSYDQLVRYKRWFKDGYMSSTGTCFDIGGGTRVALNTFEERQQICVRELRTKFGCKIPSHSIDRVVGEKLQLKQTKIDLNCGDPDGAGNGALMRLAPVPLFFFRSKSDAIENAGKSSKTTHSDERSIDACRYYAALIWGAINNIPKDQLLSLNYFRNTFNKPLNPDLMPIVEGSYKKKKGYDGGIRGKGFVINSLEAALWAFYNDGDSFEKGARLAVNLGDDTDTTAAIYGQLAGATYGIESIPKKWLEEVFQLEFLKTIANGLWIKGNDSLRVKRKRSQSESEDSDDDESARARTTRPRPSRRQKLIMEYD